jgi:phenylacetate-CoA ligase
MAQIVVRMVPELADPTILLNRFPLFAPVSFVFEEVLRQVGACHIAAGNMTWEVPFDRALGFISRLGVTALAALPLEPILLREVALMQGLDLREIAASLKVIFAGGAVLPPSMRRVIERDWGVRVVEIYGSNETMLLGVSCKENRLHLCDELLEIEILDPVTQAPVPPGSAGILTITSLVHEAMPLVRYSTGDQVALTGESCDCGERGPVAAVYGRYEERIEIDGATATAYDVLDAAYEFAERHDTRVFFVLVRRRGLHLLIEVKDPARAVDAAAERRLAERIGLPVTVEYLRHNEVLDRTAMFRTPRIYKPGQIADWRRAGRRPITIMEALLEWPRFDARTVLRILVRQLRNLRRRRRILAEDRRG